jgi:hypothetical protein
VIEEPTQKTASNRELLAACSRGRLHEVTLSITRPCELRAMFSWRPSTATTVDPRE